MYAVGSADKKIWRAHLFSCHLLPFRHSLVQNTPSVSFKNNKYLFLLTSLSNPNTVTINNKPITPINDITSTLLTFHRDDTARLEKQWDGNNLKIRGRIQNILKRHRRVMHAPLYFFLRNII